VPASLRKNGSVDPVLRQQRLAIPPLAVKAFEQFDLVLFVAAGNEDQALLGDGPGVRRQAGG
jgi:hypothetical protein